jgi:DNA modification methylase
MGLRDYQIAPVTWADGWHGCLGLEPTLEAYVAHLVEVLQAVKRVLRDDGVLWLTLGDAFTGGGRGGQEEKHACKQATNRGSSGSGVRPPQPRGMAAKNLCLIPQRVALALQEDGWIVRSWLPWLKRNVMPSSQKDRPTVGTEVVLLLVKQPKYWFDLDAVRQAHTRGAAGSRFDTGKTGVNGLGRVSTQARQEQAGRTLRDTDLWFASEHAVIGCEEEVLAVDIVPQPFSSKSVGLDTEHYAAFPPRLCDWLIKMGTSEAGCCGQCGAPYQRQVERDFHPSQRTAKGEGNKGLDASNGWGATSPGANIISTLGFAPSCACVATALEQGSRDVGHMEGLLTPVPCTILDPFCGSGSTLLAAARLGRHGIGIDIKSEYVALARARLQQDGALLFQEQTSILSERNTPHALKE